MMGNIPPTGVSFEYGSHGLNLEAFLGSVDSVTSALQLGLVSRISETDLPVSAGLSGKPCCLFLRDRGKSFPGIPGKELLRAGDRKRWGNMARLQGESLQGDAGLRKNVRRPAENGIVLGPHIFFPVSFVLPPSRCQAFFHLRPFFCCACVG